MSMATHKDTTTPCVGPQGSNFGDPLFFIWQLTQDVGRKHHIISLVGIRRKKSSPLNRFVWFVLGRVPCAG